MLEEKKEKSKPDIYNSLREMILNKEILPGEKINQITIAKLLNTSRTPVVNALHRLESEGLVDNRKNSGFFVHRLSMQELLELFELREALDIVIINNIVRSISDDEVDELYAIFAPYIENPDFSNYEDYRRRDMKFHFRLASLCNNQMVNRVNEKLQIFTRACTAGLLRPAEETLAEHLAVLEAIKARDAAAAEKNMRKHISITSEIIRKTVTGLIQVGLNPESINVDEISLN